MKKIMFNDDYGLTYAVLQGRKTMTRRVIKPQYETIKAYNANFETYILGELDGETFEVKPCYYICEKVAIAQSYKDLGWKGDEIWRDPKSLDGKGVIQHSPGWTNKMFVRAEACFHRIRITDIKIERLQDISDEDCLREGIYEVPFCEYSWEDNGVSFGTPREAFAALIDKVSRKGTWARNQLVFVYTFELVK